MAFVPQCNQSEWRVAALRRGAGEPLEAIATRLHLSAKTVSNYQTLIRQKLGVGTAVELLRYAQQHRLFNP